MCHPELRMCHPELHMCHAGGGPVCGGHSVGVYQPPVAGNTSARLRRAAGGMARPRLHPRPRALVHTHA
eukprot:1833661-Pyramimonas_sp.AAC.1